MSTDKTPDQIKKSSVPQRGALQVSVSPDTGIISAGSNFSIAISISNPFDVPITIGSVSTLLPVDLYDTVLTSRVAERQMAEQRLQAVREKLILQIGKKTSEQVDTGKEALQHIRRFVFSSLPFFPVDVARDFTSTAIARASETDNSEESIKQHINTETKIIGELERIEEKEIASEDAIMSKLNDLQKLIQDQFKQRYEQNIEQPVTLFPGDSVTKVFNLRTRQSLAFRPTSYNLNILVSYKVENTKHSQTVSYSLNIHSGISAVIIGAAIGSVFGVLANNPTLPRIWEEIPLKFLPSLIVSIFAVIAFARKEGVQPIIAIQDIWGGLFMGFLIGYTGPEVFGNLFGGINRIIPIQPTFTPVP